MKVLFYGETPVAETGAGRVDRHIIDVLVELGIEVEVIGMSHAFETYDRMRYPYDITSINSHEEAAEKLAERIDQYDTLFISADMHVPGQFAELFPGKRVIVLGAIDGPVFHKDQVHTFQDVQYPIVYSRYAYNQVLNVLPELKGKLYCTPLGCEPDTVYPISAEERKEYRKRVFGIGDDTFLVMNVNRNQRRKDLARSIAAFKLFHDRVPDSKLFLLSCKSDVGGDLGLQSYFLGLDPYSPTSPVMFCPPEYTPLAGFERDKYNRMLCSADVGISTAQGEGWGLTTTEFLAAQTPFIGPANTSFFEILGRERERGAGPGSRGYLVKCGGNELFSVFYGHDDSVRPITSVEDMAKTIEHVYYHRDEAATKAKRGRKWAKVHTWEKFKDQWRAIILEAEADGE